MAINEVRNPDGALYLELKVPSKIRLQGNVWSFLEKYGYRYDKNPRPLLASEVWLL